MSKIKVDTIEGSTGTTITVPSGQTLTVTDGIPATNLSGTIADARLPTVPVAKGGTGLTSLGSANQQVRVNSAGNALEFATISGGTVPIVETFNNTLAFFSTSNYYTFNDVTALDTTITPSASSSKIFIFVHLDCATTTHHYMMQFRIQRKIGSGSFGNTVTNGYSGSDSLASSRSARAEYDTNGSTTLHGMFVDIPNTTDAVTYRIGVNPSSGAGTMYLNRNASDGNNSSRWQRAYGCKIIAMELKQ